jgi:hypothetical protein
MHFARLAIKRSVEGIAQAIQYDFLYVLFGDPLQEQFELVSAHPCELIGASKHAAEPVGNLFEHLVSVGVPKAVVDRLEFVDVDVDDCEVGEASRLFPLCDGLP